MHMLPDFQRLRQPSSSRPDFRSLEHRSDNDFSHLKSFNERDGEDSQRNRAAKSAPKQTTKKAFTYVPEAQDDFLALWPHRFDYLFAPHPDPGSKPDWKTESSHLLSDRLIEQGAFLFGVRPGSTTAYILLDIDSGSPYHPRRDPLAFQRLCDALEPLGLIEHLTVTSSDSKGLHLYFPCSEPLPSWQLAIGITALLENAGFKIMPGWLEVFPNPKPFATDGTLSLFNGHRLPLQQGSYLLNDDLSPTASTQSTFVRYWQQAAKRNDICLPLLEQTIRQSRRQNYRVTGKADKFINDLNAEIEPGWSGPGQTNHLLGRIAMRSYIFGHVLYATEPLKGKALADDIVRVATSLPGYQEFCGHQHEIEAKAREWVSSIESSRYFPYATGKAKQDSSQPSWNQRQREQARDRIQSTVLDLFRQDNWPSGTTARFKRLTAAKLSAKSLYKHQDLWHPEFMRLSLDFTPVEIPPDPPVLQTEGENDCAGGASIPPSRTSLLGGIGWNTPSDKALSPLGQGLKAADAEAGWNTSEDRGVQREKSHAEFSEPVRSAPPQQLVLDIQRALAAARAAQQAERDKYQQQPNGQSRATVEHLARLRDWIDSGDPILMAEARQQLSRLKSSS
jgi:hypothetical protein